MRQRLVLLCEWYCKALCAASLSLVADGEAGLQGNAVPNFGLTALIGCASAGFSQYMHAYHLNALHCKLMTERRAGGWAGLAGETLATLLASSTPWRCTISRFLAEVSSQRIMPA